MTIEERMNRFNVRLDRLEGMRADDYVSLKRRVQDLERRHDLLQASDDSLGVRIDEVESNFSELANWLDSIAQNTTTNLRAIEKRLDKLADESFRPEEDGFVPSVVREELHALRKERDAYDRSVAELEKKNRTIAHELALAKQDVNRLREERNSYFKQCEGWKKHSFALEKQVDKLTRKVESLDKIAARWEKRYDSVSNRLTEPLRWERDDNGSYLLTYIGEIDGDHCLVVAFTDTFGNTSFYGPYRATQNQPVSWLSRAMERGEVSIEDAYDWWQTLPSPKFDWFGGKLFSEFV